jgi:hypothetical protein
MGMCKKCNEIYKGYCKNCLTDEIPEVLEEKKK